MNRDSYHHGDLRAALVRAASSVLETDGAAAISLRALARELGVSHTAPAHHFGSRAALLAELAAEGYAELADELTAALDRSEPAQWLAATGRAYVRFALANPERYRLMFTSRLRLGDCPPRLDVESTRAYRALLRAAHGTEPDNPHITSRMRAPELRAWSMVHGAVMLWLDGQLDGVLTEAEFLERVDEVLGDPTSPSPEAQGRANPATQATRGSCG